MIACLKRVDVGLAPAFSPTTMAILRFGTTPLWNHADEKIWRDENVEDSIDGLWYTNEVVIVLLTPNLCRYVIDGSQIDHISASMSVIFKLCQRLSYLRILCLLL